MRGLLIKEWFNFDYSAFITGLNYVWVYLVLLSLNSKYMNFCVSAFLGKSANFSISLTLTVKNDKYKIKKLKIDFVHKK